jgi:hypothetical protein
MGFFRDRLASNLDPPNLDLTSSYDYRPKHLLPAAIYFKMKESRLDKGSFALPWARMYLWSWDFHLPTPV